MTEPTLREKSNILYRQGLLADRDRSDPKRIESRWLVYQSTTQKTARAGKKVVEPEPA
jgi:hypothetical protein